MKRIKTVLLAVVVLFTVSCGGSGGGSSVPANDEAGLPSNLIGLWGLEGRLYVQLSAPLQVEIWILADLENCYNFAADIFTPLGSNNYRDSAGDVVNLTASSNGGVLNFRVDNLTALIPREIGLDSSDLPICNSKWDTDATQKLDSGLLELFGHKLLLEQFFPSMMK
jgi:hypothetical protein